MTPTDIGPIPESPSEPRRNSAPASTATSTTAVAAAMSAAGFPRGEPEAARAPGTRTCRRCELGQPECGACRGDELAAAPVALSPVPSPARAS